VGYWGQKKKLLIEELKAVSSFLVKNLAKVITRELGFYLRASMTQKTGGM